MKIFIEIHKLNYHVYIYIYIVLKKSIIKKIYSFIPFYLCIKIINIIDSKILKSFYLGI